MAPKVPPTASERKRRQEALLAMRARMEIDESTRTSGEGSRTQMDIEAEGRDNEDNNESEEGDNNESEEEDDEEDNVDDEDADGDNEEEEGDEENEDNTDDEATEDEEEAQGNEIAGPKIQDVIRDFDTHIASTIWKNEERSPLTCVNHAHKILGWEIPDDATTFRAMVESTGLLSIVATCYRCVNKNLISAFVERWHPETNTFHLPFGEMTITLDDVASLLHIPVVGKPVENCSFEYEDAIRIACKYLGITKEVAEDQINDRVGNKLSLSMLYGLFEGVNDTWNERKTRRAARAYLLYLLGNTLFADKSKSHVHMALLDPLKNLNDVCNYSWGSAALAVLYRQLGLASRVGVKQIAGYLCLLETWIFEHFPCFHPSTKLYYENFPRVARWDPSPDSNLPCKDIRIFLDNIQPGQVIFDPYMSARQFHPFHDIAWYFGCIIGMNIVGPYHPGRVLRQFGRVQIIPPPPIPPVNTRARRGHTSTTYGSVSYVFVGSMWAQWQSHVLANNYRSIPLYQSNSSCTEEYVEWFNRHGVIRVHNPLYPSGNFPQGPPHNQPTYDQLYTTIRGMHDLLIDPNEVENVRRARFESERFFGGF